MELNDQGDQVEEAKDKGRKRRPIFVAEPKRSTKAITAVDPFGRPTEIVEAETAEAASHWDATSWRATR